MRRMGDQPPANPSAPDYDRYDAIRELDALAARRDGVEVGIYTRERADSEWVSLLATLHGKLCLPTGSTNAVRATYTLTREANDDPDDARARTAEVVIPEPCSAERQTWPSHDHPQTVRQIKLTTASGGALLRIRWTEPTPAA
jgi:hypothetical protein